MLYRKGSLSVFIGDRMQFRQKDIAKYARRLEKTHRLRMKIQSGKNKGRKLQKWFRSKLIDLLDIHSEDVESRSMGAGGEDIIMSRSARNKFPYSIECKNVERLNIYEAYKQACSNCNGYEPIVVIKRNRHKPLIVVDAEYFIGLHRDD